MDTFEIQSSKNTFVSIDVPENGSVEITFGEGGFIKIVNENKDNTISVKSTEDLKIKIMYPHETEDKIEEGKTSEGSEVNYGYYNIGPYKYKLKYDFKNTFILESIHIMNIIPLLKDKLEKYGSCTIYNYEDTTATISYYDIRDALDYFKCECKTEEKMEEDYHFGYYSIGTYKYKLKYDFKNTFSFESTYLDDILPLLKNKLEKYGSCIICDSNGTTANIKYYDIRDALDYFKCECKTEEITEDKVENKPEEVLKVIYDRTSGYYSIGPYEYKLKYDFNDKFTFKSIHIDDIIPLLEKTLDKYGGWMIYESTDTTTTIQFYSRSEARDYANDCLYC